MCVCLTISLISKAAIHSFYGPQRGESHTPIAHNLPRGSRALLHKYKRFIDLTRTKSLVAKPRRQQQSSFSFHSIEISTIENVNRDPSGDSYKNVQTCQSPSATPEY